MTELIRYRSGYKYQLVETYSMRVAIEPAADIATDYVELTREGTITLNKSYAWDGPSGPAFDTKNFMRGSLVHDALYQLMRLEKLDAKVWRQTADRELRRICRDDGMTWIRASWVYRGVRAGGGPAASGEPKPDLEAP